MSKASPMVLWTLLLVLYLCILHTYGQTGNRLENGKIVWGDLEPDDEYKTTGYKADLGGLEPYYNLAKSFIRSSLAENLPVGKLYICHLVTINVIYLFSDVMHESS